MTKVIAFGSGKGGVGKTTLALNIGFAIASLNKKTLVIDGDVSLPNLDLYTGIEHPMVTLLEVLNNNANVNSAIYTIQMGLDILPCGSSLQALKGVNIERLEEIISELRNSRYEYIILDVAAGLSKFSIIPMMSADEVILVVNPDIASIADAQKLRAIAAVTDINITGIIVNRYTKRYEDIGVRIGLPVIGAVPEDSAVIKARDEKKPLIAYKRSPSAKAVMSIARKICGVPEKKSIFQRLLR